MTGSTSTTINGADELTQAGWVTEKDNEAIRRVAARYAVAVTPALVELMDKNNPNDPIARQFIPSINELAVSADEVADPIGDETYSPVEGIVHRYPDRVLLKAVHVCPVYCRFCFRREVVGPKGLGSLTPSGLENGLSYIAGHPQIWEVILTGGDPFILSNRRLEQIMQALSRIDHVKVIRLHTRVPVASPERVDEALVSALQLANKAVYVAVHINHPRELSTSAREACARLVDAGIPLLSQTVLLKGVNDNEDTLETLMRSFVELRIRPYYLHQLDLAPGTGHFRVSINRGQELMRHLQGRVSGLCQPTYVLDIPGGFGKAPIGPNYVQPDGQDQWQVEDYRGEQHRYPPKG